MSVRTREKNVESFLVKKLSKLNVHCYKVLPDNRIGMPDRLITLPGGRCIWVELKTDNGKLSVVQQLRHKELRDAGQEVAVVWSKEDADRLAESVGNTLSAEK